jgi:hypothetical protein
MWRAARLEADFYEEVEAEKRSIVQAAVVVALACAAGACGSWLAGLPAGRIVVDIVEPLVLWIGGSVFSYMVGATFFRGPETETDFLEVLRTTGFAFAPGLLRFFAFVPPVDIAGFLIAFLGDAWVLVAAVVAVRQALDFTTARAIGTFGVAYALLWLVLWAFITLPI